MQWENIIRIEDLRMGDVIRGKSSGETFIVTDIFGSRATAVRVADVTNPIEWQRLERSKDMADFK